MNFRLSLLVSLSLATLSVVSAQMPIDPAIPPATQTHDAPVVTNAAFAGGAVTKAPLPASPQRRAPSTSRPSMARTQPLFASTARGAGVSARALTDYPQDLQNIVRACGSDPLKLFEIVRNEIRFQPYRGFRKGAVLTWQTKSGSDADQSQLLVELLTAAGFEAFYYYGVAVLPEADAFAWWGADNLTAMNMLTGSSGYLAGSTGDGNYAVEQIFVVVNIGGSYYYWVPAFKPMAETTGIDLVAATGYNRTNLLAAAGGTVTSTAVQGVSESAVTGYLADRAAALRTVIHDDHPNASVGEIVGERRIVAVTLVDPSEGLPAGWDVLPGFDNFAFDDPYASYSGDVSGTTLSFATTMQLYVGPSNAAGTDLTSYIVMFGGQMSDFAGHQVTVGFSAANKAQILIDGAVVAEAPSPYAGDLGMKYYIDHPYVAGAATAYDAARFSKIRPGGRYALNVGTGGYERGEVRRRQRSRFDAFVRQGLAPTTPTRVDASLCLLGLDWLQQRDQATDLLGRIQRVQYIEHHTVAIAGQETGFFVDIPVVGVGIARDGTTATTAEFRRAYIQLGSAIEHSVIEQNYPDMSAVSTVRYMRQNNLAGGKTYYATSANYATIAADPEFIAGWSASWRNTYLPNAIAAGATLVLPQNGAITMGSLTGNGYFEIYASSITAKINPGFLNGGYATEPGTADGTVNPTPNDDTPGRDNKQSADPIDLYSGACVADQTDLTLGSGGARGLSLSRHYSSLADAGPSGLGRGWSHNFEGFLTEHTDTLSAFGGTIPESAANAIVVVQAIADLSRSSLGTAKGWVITSIASFWALEQAKNNTVTATFGRKSYAFTRQADGAFSPSAGVTGQLIKESATGLYRIEERYGQALYFDTLKRLSSFADADGKTLSLDYATSGTDIGKLQTVTDCYGRTLTFAYFADTARAGLLANVVDSTGRTVSYDYTDGQLTSVTDPETHSRTYEYDTVGRLWKTYDEQARLVTETLYDDNNTVRTQIAEGDSDQTWLYAFTGVLNTETNPLGETTSYRYDSKGRLVAETNGEGHTAKRTYDGQNHVVSVADALGNSTSFQYDGRHNLRFVTDARDFTTEHRYDEQDHLRYTIDALGKQTEFRYDDEHHLVKTIDPLLRETTIEYHTSGQADGLPWKVISPNGDTTITYYDANGYPSDIARPDGSEVAVTYNDRGDVLNTQTTTVGDPNTHAVSFTYDDNRRLLTSTDALGFGTTNTFDETGNLEAVEDRYGNVVSFTHSAWGRKLTAASPSGAITYFGYDHAGRTATVTDALGQITRLGYDHAGRLTTTTDPLDQAVTRTYDDAGRSDSLTNARGKTWLFGHTATGQPETTTTPLNRLADTVYNARGQPEIVTEPSLQATTFTYNDDARLDTTTDDVGTITFGYNANGRLETAVEGGKTLTRHYNSVGQLDTFTDGDGNAIAYEYDGAGNLTELTYPGSPARRVTYTYDSADRLDTVTDWAARVTQFRYDAQSRLWKIELPNGTQRVFTYDSAGRVAQVRDEVAAGGSLVSQFTLGYDSLDRIIEETPLPEPAQFAVTPASMSYDDDDRLTAWNALATVSDTDGNLTSGPLSGVLATFAYDARNRLTSVGNSTFTYDAENRRTSRTVAGVTTTFVHDPNAALSRLLQSTNGGTTTRYIYAGSMLLYAETGSALRVHHYDYRGSTVALTDSTGAVLGRVTYGSYGEIVARTGNTATELLYNGRDGVITDPNGLYHMRARYYSPETRRFLNADPIGFGGGDNWYAYVGGSPVMQFDPSGLWFGVDDAVFAGVGAVVGVGGRFVGDLITGNRSTWEDFVGAAIGGAAGGEALLYTANPFIAGAVGGAAGNAATQGLKMLSGKQSEFDVGSLVFDSAFGAATGFIPGRPRIPGVNLGRGSDVQVFRQIVTKASKGSIDGIETSTAWSMVRGAYYQYAFGQGAAAGALGSTWFTQFRGWLTIDADGVSWGMQWNTIDKCPSS